MHCTFIPTLKGEGRAAEGGPGRVPRPLNKHRPPPGELRSPSSPFQGEGMDS
jgi:hypothetical protein